MSGNTRLKRKLGKDPHDGDGKRVPSKRSKEEFNAFEFKSKLKEHTKALPALTNFIQLVKEDDSSNDVVDSYLKISGECNEIFNLMEGERRPGTEMQIIFEALECILVRITDRLKHHKATALQIVQRMLQNHMKPIYNALSVGSTSRYLKLCLRLLTAMVMQDTLTAREVQTHFNFQLPSLVSIMNRRDSKATEDVRICFARFATSFLISSDDQVIQKLIEVRGFFNGILRGIKTDRASTVHLLLTTLKEKVINNSAISKTSKMRLFSENTLQSLVSLFKWEGQYDFELDQNKTDNDDDNEDIQGVEGLSIVRNLVQDFLITLTCSYKFGINFYDRSIGTSGRNQNTILLKFLLSLKSITGDPLVVDLIIKILTACPDLLSKYLTQSDQSFSPRLSERWLTNMDLLMKVYQNQPEVPPSFQVTDKVPVSKLVTMTMVTTVPVVATRAMLSQGIKSVSRRVQFITLKLMSMILKRVKSALEHCQHPDSSKICTVYNGEERQKFIELYQESLCKILPEIHIISSCWQKVTKKNQRGVKDKKENSMETGEHEDVAMETKAGIKPEGAETDEKAPPVTVLKAQILQVLCSYQHTFPESFVQCDYDFSRLLYGVISTDTHTDMTDDTSHLTVQYFAFQLLLHSAPGKFRWFKNVKGQGTGISILLELLVTTQHPQLKSITRQLIDKVLQETGIFELTQDEISIWLSKLERQDKSDTSVLIDYMERLLIKVVFNPYPLTDRIIDIVSEANTMNSDSGDDTHSIGESGIDAILSMGDISMEAGPSGVMSSPELSNKSSAWCSESFPFSPLVVGVLQDWVGGSDNIKSGCVDKFLFEIIKDILHGQLNPAPLCLLVQQIFTHDDPDQEVPPLTLSNHQKELLTYTAMFLPSNKKVEKTPKKKKSEKHQSNFDQEMKFSDIIYDGFQTRQGDGILCNTEEVKNCIDKIISIDDIILAVKQVLLYANSVITCPTIHKIAKKKTLLKTYFLLVEKLHQRSLKVVENLQTNETHETDDDDDDGGSIEKSKNDDFIGELNLNELTQTKKKREAPQVLEVVLSHPLCLEWFLPSVESVPNSTVMMSSEERSELSALITEFVFDFLKYILDKSTQSEITRIMTPYTSTTVAFVSNTIQNLGKKDKKGQNIDRLELEQGLKVLLTLQQFWSASDVQGLVDKCLQMSHDRLVSVTDDGSKVTVLGETLLTFLESCHISSESFRKLITLMHGSKCVEVDRAVFNMINNNPQLVFNTTMTTMKYCLQSPSQVRIQLAVLLLTHSLAHHIKFQEWCSLQDSEDDHMTNHKDVYLPLVCVFMRRATTSTPLEQKKSDVIEKLNRIYQTWLSTWLVDGSHGNSSENDIKFTVWCQLLKCTDPDTQIEILHKLQHKVTVKQVWSRYQVEACLKILQSLESSSSSSSTKGKLLTMSLSFVTGCLQCLNVQHKAERQDDQLESILYQSVSTVAMELDAISSSKEFAPVWNRFVKTGLKCRYRNERLLQTLMLLVPKVYHSNHANKIEGMVYLPTIYQMVLSHSQFLSTMLATEERQQQSVRVKESLVKFLVLMADLNPVCCETAHFGVLLSAYGATLSKTDQLLLHLMNIYENNDAIMWEFRPYIWGPSALDHHSNRKKFGRSLWNEPNMRDILNLLDKDKMYETVMKFPWRRTLKPSHHDNRVVDSSVYDPSFLLPLFSHLLTPESVVDCKRFIEWHGLGLAVATLSSIDSAMRAAAYHVIMSYFHHLEGARFHEQRQILYLLNCLKNSITEPNTRISSVMTIFITKVIQLFLTPQSAMYSMVQKFLLIKPEFNLHTIPQLQRLLFSSDMEYKQQHTWILQLCEAGLKDHTDFYIYNKKCHLFKLIMAFYNSPTCNKATKQQILKILECAIVIRSGAMELGRYQGLLPWLHSNVIRGDGSLLEDTLTIVSKFWSTVSSSPGKQTKTDTGREGKQESTVSLRTIVGVLQICAAVIQQLQERVTPQFLHSLVDLIHSVMSYQHKIYGDTVTWHVIKPDHFVVCLYKYGGIFQDQEILENLKGESSGLIGKSQGKNIGKERKKQSGDKDEKRADEEEICSDLQNECLQNLLQTLYCLGSQSFTKSQLPSLSVIFLLRWSLQRTYEMSNIKIQIECMLQQLTWMCDIIRNSEDVKDLLLKEVEPDLVSLLLKVYSFTLGRMFNVPSHVTGSDVIIEEEVEKSFQSGNLTQEQSIVCNDILNTLNAVFWHLTQHCMLPTNEDKYGEFGSVIRNDVYTVNLKLVSHNAAENAGVQKSTELEAMLMQELWTKCDEPSHFMMAQQTQQTVLPVSQKKSKKTEGKKQKVKTPRKSSKK